MDPWDLSYPCTPRWDPAGSWTASFFHFIVYQLIEMLSKINILRPTGPGMFQSVQGPTRVPPSVTVCSLSVRPMRAVHGPGMSTYTMDLECPDNWLALCILRHRTRSADVCPWPHESATICLRRSSVPLAPESLSSGRACTH